MKPVAIGTTQLSEHRKNSISEIPGFEDYLKSQNIPYERVDCYRYDLVKELDKYSALIWWYENYAIADLLEGQNILDVAALKGLKVFPNHQTGWHFDDKIAEMYALQSVDAPIPESWVFYRKDECIDWLRNKAEYPLVAKLRCGSGSNNVKLLKDLSAAVKYAKRMFTEGYQPAPSLIYKTFSKVQSTRDWQTFVKRLKRVPDFLWTRRFAKQMPVEKGYCYFQEFVPNDSFDVKVAVVGDKLSYFARKTRKGDFRASGGGDFYYDPSIMSEQVIHSAFAAADRLGLQCIGFDYVVDSRSGDGKIIEMCHGFDHEAIYHANGYYDRNCVWHPDEPLNPAAEVINNLLKDELT